MKYYRSLIVVLTMLFSICIATQSFAAWETSLSSAVSRAQTENKKILLFVHQPHNDWCDYYDERIFSNEAVSRYLERFVIARINIQADKRITDSLMVKSAPTILLLDKNGNEIDRFWEIKSLDNFVSDLGALESDARSFKALRALYGTGRATIEDKADLAREYRKRQTFSEMFAIYEDMLSEHRDAPSKAFAYYHLASRAASRKDYHLAELYFRKILANYPTFEFLPETILELASVYFTQGKKLQAKRLYERFLSTYPQRPEKHWVERRLRRCE